MSNNHQFASPRTATARNLYVVHNIVGAPAGTTLTYTLLVNGVASALTVTIAATASSGSDLVDSVSINPGDLLSFRLIKNNTLTTQVSDIIVSVEIV